MLGLYLPPVLNAVASQFRPRRSFHCRSTLPCELSAQWARWSCWWLSNYPCWDCISRRCSNRGDDFRPKRSFHCRSTLPLTFSARGRVGGAGGCPTIRAGIVSPASVEIAAAVVSTPDDHFTAGPDCRVTARAAGALVVLVAVQRIRAGIVSPAGVRKSMVMSRPRRSFHCRSRLPCERLGQRARWSCWWLSNYPCWDCISRRCSKR